jgi:hypothetical protein
VWPILVSAALRTASRSDRIGFVGNGCRNAAGTVGRQTACEATHKGGRHASNPQGADHAGPESGPGRRDHRNRRRDPAHRDPDQSAQRKALYQSELERNLQQRTQAGDEAAVGQRLAAQRKALYQSELERNLATAAERAATRPSAQIDPAPSPGVDVVATLLIGLVGGLVGGAAAMIGWTATTRRRRPRAAAGT